MLKLIHDVETTTAAVIDNHNWKIQNDYRRTFRAARYLLTDSLTLSQSRKINQSEPGMIETLKFRNLSQKQKYLLKRLIEKAAEATAAKMVSDRTDRKLGNKWVQLKVIEGGTETAGIQQLRRNMESWTRRTKRQEGDRQGDNDHARRNPRNTRN